MPTDIRPEVLDVEAARVSQAARTHGRADAQAVREDRLARVVSPAGVVVRVVGRVVALPRARRVWRVSLRRLILEVHATRVRDPDAQRRVLRVLVVRLVHRPTDLQEVRAVRAVLESLEDKVGLGLKETQENQDQARKGTIGSRKDLLHTNPDWALRSPQEATVSRTSG
jgi:hypothetical protein